MCNCTTGELPCLINFEWGSPWDVDARFWAAQLNGVISAVECYWCGSCTNRCLKLLQGCVWHVLCSSQPVQCSCCDTEPCRQLALCGALWCLSRICATGRYHLTYITHSSRRQTKAKRFLLAPNLRGDWRRGTWCPVKGDSYPTEPLQKPRVLWTFWCLLLLAPPEASAVTLLSLISRSCMAGVPSTASIAAFWLSTWMSTLGISYSTRSRSSISIKMTKLIIKFQKGPQKMTLLVRNAVPATAVSGMKTESPLTEYTLSICSLLSVRSGEELQTWPVCLLQCWHPLLALLLLYLSISASSSLFVEGNCPQVSSMGI